MPLRKGAKVGDSIRELHEGKTFAKTKAKFGKKRAQKQAIAIAEKNKRAGKSGKKSMKRARK
jgi:hypothetical protein